MRLVAALLACLPLVNSQWQNEIRAKLHYLSENGLNADILEYIQQVKKQYGTLEIDDQAPSLYSYLGLALYSVLKVDESEIAFKEAARMHPTDLRVWSNLGEIQVQSFKLDEAIESFTSGYIAGDDAGLSRILRTKGWACNWEGFEGQCAGVEKAADQCYLNNNCKTDSVGGSEYTDMSGPAYRLINSYSPNARDSPVVVTRHIDISPWDTKKKSRSNSVKRPRLKVGIVSSDFGVHPVSTLIRGMVQFLDKSKIELFCFGIHTKVSWWGLNITETAEHVVWLHEMNTFDAANIIARAEIDILIDLNGHTMHSGLPIFAHRPCPVQMTFLGLPSTTSSSFVDYFLGDYIAMPPEHQDHFSERLLLMPPCYIVNDFAQIQGDIVTKFSSTSTRAPVSSLVIISPTRNGTVNHAKMREKVKRASFLFSTLSNSAKMDPNIFHVWMNILRRYPTAVMLLNSYSGYFVSFPHLIDYARYHGIESDALISLEQTPWLDHHYVKTCMDLILDTRTKTGHTTGLDGVWAGVPTITFAGGANSAARAGESMAVTLESEYGLVYTLKEYEDLAMQFASQKDKKSCRRYSQSESDNATEDSCKQPLGVWRHFAGRKRVTSSLFDTRKWTDNFTHMLQANWEVSILTRFNASRYHIFQVGKKREDEVEMKPISLSQTYSDQSIIHKPAKGSGLHESVNSGRQKSIVYSSPLEEGDLVADSEGCGVNCPIPESILNSPQIMLNIGGIARNEGWLIVNAQRTMGTEISHHVDIVRLMNDLHGFPNESVSAIYASHILEHNDYQGVHHTLTEWHRVLKPGGMVFISVPDIETIARMYVEMTDFDVRWHLTKMMYGGQSDPYDHHKTGFHFDLLKNALLYVGFCQVERLQDFNLNFQDCSTMQYQGHYISLNVAAKICMKKDVHGGVIHDIIDIQHNGSPYQGSRVR